MEKKPKKPVKPIKPKKPFKLRQNKPRDEEKDNTSIIPTIKRYFYNPENDIDLTKGFRISATLFINDAGKNTITFTTFRKNGYINLYVNGVMQQGGLYKVQQNSLTFVPTNSKIRAGTPIIIESIGFNVKSSGSIFR